MNRTAVIAGLAAGVLAVAVAPGAQASGSGNPFQDIQVGVTYTVYQPTYTAGLKQGKVTSVSDAGSDAEENLSAEYGSKKAGDFRIQEGNPMATDIGQGALVLTRKVQGRTAKVYAYCDPSSASECTVADVARYGGHLDVTLPGANGLRKTRVWVETIGPNPISGQQLVRIAQGLRPLQ